MKTILKIGALAVLLTVVGCVKKPQGPCDPTKQWCTHPGKVEIEVTKPDMPEFDPFDYQKDEDNN